MFRLSEELWMLSVVEADIVRPSQKLNFAQKRTFLAVLIRVLPGLR
jgi:hypothetical protein